MTTFRFSFRFSLAVGLILAWLVSWSMFIPLPVQAEEIIYKPPVTTVPIRRIGTSVRGTCKPISGSNHTVALQVLAPETIGQTASVQPTLYWWISTPVSGKFIFTVTDSSQNFSEPLLDTTQTLSINAGIQVFSLAEHHVSLQSGIIYKWSITLECDANNPSLNIVTTGLVKQVTPNAELGKRLKQTLPEKLPYLYAITSYWYDSLHSLEELIRKHPTDNKWREVRVNLLRQGGLNKIAIVEK